MRRLIDTSFVYAALAMAGGVFYREFTRFQNFSDRTALGVVHTHLFLLGMFFFLIAALLDSRLSLRDDGRFGIFYLLYNAGVLVTAGTLAWRGVTEVLELPLSRAVDASISGVAGIGHILTGAGLVLFFLIARARCRARGERVYTR